MNTRRSNKKPEPNKLILPGIILACLPAVMVPITIIHPSTQPYLLFFLPFGVAAAVLARIALNQIKRGYGTPQDRSLAIITYFVGLAPILFYCGLFTYSLTFR